MRAAERFRPLAWYEPWVVLAPLVVAQWTAVVVFAHVVRRNGWLFYQGGDQTWFWTSGWVLGHGHVPETYVGWAWALAMTPLAALAGPNFLAGVPLVVLLQVGVLLPLALLCIYEIASAIGGRVLGYWAAAWWVAAPYLVIPLFVDRYHKVFVEQALPQGLGLTGLGDFPSMVAVLVSATLLVRGLRTGARAEVIGSAFAAGIAIGIKPANGLFVAAPLVALALARRWQSVLEYAAALVPALIVLAIWKEKGSGIALLANAPLHLAAGANAPHFSEPTLWERLTSYVPLDRTQLNNQFLGFREFFWSARVLEFIPVAGAIAVARRSIPLAAFLSTWLAAYFVVKGSSPAVDVATGSIWRLLMPAWPAYLLLGASLPLLLPRIGTALAERFRTVPRPVRAGTRALAAIGVALFAIPAVAFAALPSDDTRTAAKIPERSLFLPVDGGFHVRARGIGDGSIRLTWRPPPGHAHPFYVVLRSPSRFVFPYTEDVVTQGMRCKSPGGAIRCTLEMNEIGRTRQRLFRDTPGRGRWTYRVGTAANWLDDPEQGDVLVVSEPLDVVVR